MLQLDHERQKKLFAYGTPTTDALAALTNLWGNNVPTLFDPMAVAYACGQRFCDAEQQSVVVEDSGQDYYQGRRSQLYGARQSA